jgi:3-hydroxyisobutyrate dehydrogenase
MADVAFLGLGVMGYPMARHLAARGHHVTVFNRTTTKALGWVAAHGGRAAPTPREAAHGQDFVFACVGNDDDLRAVTLGADGAFAGMKPGAIFVDHTTASADVARELAAVAAESGLAFIDAPVSGGQAGAENGALTVMCGGDPHAYAAAEPVIAAFAKACRLMGPSGAGQLTKMVNQICIAGLVQGSVRRACLRPRRQVSTRSGDRRDLQGRRRLLADGEPRQDHEPDGKFDFGFAVDWMRKDLGICCSTRRAATERPAGHGAGRPVLCARSRRWAAAVGTRRA